MLAGKRPHGQEADRSSFPRGSVETLGISRFIVYLQAPPKTKNGYDRINTYVERLSIRDHFIPSRESDTALDISNSFFRILFKHHDIPDSKVSDLDLKFTSKTLRGSA